MSDIIVKERLNSLESTLQGFITSTDAIMSRMEQDTADFKMRTENMLERIMLRMERDTSASKLRTDTIVERMECNMDNLSSRLDHTIKVMCSREQRSLFPTCVIKFPFLIIFALLINIKILELKEMEISVTIPQIKVKDIVAVLQEQYNIEPQQELTITFQVKTSTFNLPSYDVPKKYPEEIRNLVKRAKQKAKEKQGYSREQAFQDIFKIQEKIAKENNPS